MDSEKKISVQMILITMFGAFLASLVEGLVDELPTPVKVVIVCFILFIVLLIVFRKRIINSKKVNDALNKSPKLNKFVEYTILFTTFSAIGVILWRYIVLFHNATGAVFVLGVISIASILIFAIMSAYELYLTWPSAKGFEKLKYVMLIWVIIFIHVLIICFPGFSGSIVGFFLGLINQ